MDLISFSCACRACRETDAERRSYEYDETINKLPLAGWSDFEVTQLVELMNRDLAVKCPFCGSPSLEVLELIVNGQSLFDYEQLSERCVALGLVIFSLTVDKVGGQLNVHQLVKPTEVPLGVLLLTLDHLTKLVNERPAHDFAPDARGSFYACAVGCWDTEASKRAVRPLKYTCRGLTREEVLFVMQAVKDDIATP